MPDTEKMNKLIDKWHWLLEGLGKAKYKLYKYSKIYENISKEVEDQNVLKLILPLAYRVFKERRDINVSRSGKNSILILEIEKLGINHMNLDLYMSFLDSTTEMVVERLDEESINSLYKIELKDKDGKYYLSITY